MTVETLVCRCHNRSSCLLLIVTLQSQFLIQSLFLIWVISASISRMYKCAPVHCGVSACTVSHEVYAVLCRPPRWLLISLFELNTPEFTMLLGALPKTFQDGATKLLHNHLKNSSNTSSVVRSPVPSLIRFYIKRLNIYSKDFVYIMFCSVMFTKDAFIWSKNTVITVISWNIIAFSKNRFQFLYILKYNLFLWWQS